MFYGDEGLGEEGGRWNEGIKLGAHGLSEISNIQFFFQMSPCSQGER